MQVSKIDVSYHTCYGAGNHCKDNLKYCCFVLDRRVTTLSVGWLVFCGLFCSFLYFNATLESKGEKIKFRDAIGNFIKYGAYELLLIQRRVQATFICINSVDAAQRINEKNKLALI